MPDPVLKIRNISKFFAKKIVLNNITLDINAGEIFGIIGASGSGKTTLLNTLVGYHRPERGDVLFRHGKAFASVYGKRFAAKHLCGFASQLPSYYKKLTVAENLAYFGSLYGLSSGATAKNQKTILELIDLAPAEHVLAENLSGGMERRLDIACALIHDPPIIILDEPTADLDPYLKEHLHGIILAINKKGTTVIISSHHLADMERLCARIAILSRGTIIESGTPEEIRLKYSRSEEVIVETYPGDYAKMIEHLTGPVVQKKEVRGTCLVITTTNTPRLLSDLLTIADESGEDVIDLKVNKVTLEKIFLSLVKK